jgi:pyruvate/2-oxoglutarate dehydrogenase complex dihydrolipoamide acyltransferase (E2) component
MLAACGHDSSPDFVSGLIERHSKGGGELDVEGFGAVLAELDEKGGEQLAAAQEAQRAEVAEAAEAAEAAPADPPPQEATPADDDDAAASPQQATPAADSDEDAAEAPAAVAEGVASSDGGASSDGAQATEADTKPAICKTQEFYFYDVKPAAAPSPAPAAEGSDRGTNATHYFFCAGGDDSSLSERDMGVFFCSYRPPHDD